jgi:predicted CXXCH cytochrome family protein
MPLNSLGQIVRGQTMNVKVLAIGIFALTAMLLAGVSAGAPGGLFLENSPDSFAVPGQVSPAETNEGTEDCWDCDFKVRSMAEELSNTESALCYKCHDRVDEEAWVHGPVAVGECIICHDDFHGQDSAENLIQQSERACFNCHDENRLSQHAEEVISGNCVDCHNPHSSEDNRLLR